MAVPVCGPKCSMCCLVISVWGVVMLALLGLAFKLRALALFEDLPVNAAIWAEKNHDPEYVYGLYDQNAINCWIAAGIYVGTFGLSLVMWKVNQRSNYTMS